MLKVLFIGDINGKIGREAVKKVLPKLKRDLKINLVIANGENMAHGAGFTEETVKELTQIGVDWFTGGDHSFDKEKQIDKIFNAKLPVLRPANYASEIPGEGFAEIQIKNHKILLINLIGRVFMKMNHDCPFRKLDEILADKNLAKNKYSAILVDMHAEATAEKIGLGLYADGRVTGIFGTHTHVMTADHKITDKGMAYITDVGMCGSANECIGVSREGIIKTFLTQIKSSHVMSEKGLAEFNGVLVAINEKTGKASSIRPIQKLIDIK